MENTAKRSAPEAHSIGMDRDRSVAFLERVIVELGLDFPKTVSRLADALSGLCDERTRANAQRLLTLEWIGSLGTESISEPTLTDGNLRSVLARRVAAEQLLLLDAEDVAFRRGCRIDEIEAEIDCRQLWGYRVDGDLVLPIWQFEDASSPRLQLISADLPTVLRCIPESALPSLVSRLMCSEDPFLKVGAVARSPREHLLSGGSPWPVVRSMLLFLDGSQTNFADLLLGGRNAPA